MTYIAKYGYANAKAASFSLATVRALIDRLMADPQTTVYLDIERLLTEPGTTGRVSWDLCMAVQRVLEGDRMSTGELNAMVDKGTLTLPTIGEQLIKVLRTANFIIERGRITAVVEVEKA
jgi:hypothetical protein